MTESAASFFRKDEETLVNEFLQKGFLIRPASDRAALDRIREATIRFTCEKLSLDHPSDPSAFLNGIHEKVSIDLLNDVRLHVFNSLANEPWMREAYFSAAREVLETVVGNELVMQRRVNLSIQLPHDDSSLLPLHSDVWSGDSPFEVVEWVPLVDCYKTKSMYILPPDVDREYAARMPEFQRKGANALYEAIEPHLEWLEVPYGSVLVFSHTIMHGNIVNAEPETRWSMNCRFKSAFSPYYSKRLGEFFEPITMRPATRIGMDYKLPGKFNER